MIKTIQQEDMTLVNIYAPNVGAPKYIKQLLTAIKGEIHSNTIIVGDLYTPFTPMDRSSKQKINKETLALNDTLEQMDLVDIYRTFHPKTKEYTFFSNAHGTFSRIHHILHHKTSLHKFKNIETRPSIFSDHNGYETRNQLQEENQKSHKYVEIKQNATENDWVNEQIKGEIEKYLETNENENTTCQNLWDTANAILRGTFTAMQIKISNKKSNNAPKGTGKRRTKPQSSRRREIIKIRA